MKKVTLLMFFISILVGYAYSLTVTLTDEWNGFDFENWAEVSFSGLPSSTVITDTRITASIVTANNGMYEPDYYAMHLTIGGNTHYNLPNITDVSYSDLNGQSVNGQVITIYSEDIDYIPDYVTLSLSVTITYHTTVVPPLDPPVVSVELHDESFIKLNWDAVPNANSYYIDWSDTPNGTFSHLAGPFADTDYLLPSIPSRRFFKVKASSVTP